MNAHPLSLSVFGLLVAGSLFAADPYLGYVYPAAVRVGTTNRLVVGGQYLGKGLSAWVDGDGVTVTSVTNVPGFPTADRAQRNFLYLWLDTLARGSNVVLTPPPAKSNETWRSNVWWSTLNLLSDRARAIVERDLRVRRNPLQSAPALRQMAILTVVVAPDAKPGRRTMRLLKPDGISAPHRLDVVRAPVVEEPLYAPPSRPVQIPLVKSVPAVLTGQILPGETDAFRLKLRADERFRVAVVARAYEPFIGDAVPGFFNAVVRVLDPDGREIAFSDDRAGYDPDPEFIFTAPTNGTFRLEIFDRLYRGREDFVYSVRLTREKEGKAPAQRKRDALAKPKFEKRFSLEKPGTRVFEVFARRIGSKMDARLTLLDAAGNRLGVWDDVTNDVHVGTMIQDELDPVGRYAFAKPGDYRLVAEDTCGRDDPDIFCRIEVRRPSPRFAVYADRSGFCLGAGQRQPFRVAVERLDGYTGPVTLVENDEIRFDKPIVPAGTNVWKLSAIGKHFGRAMAPTAGEILAVGAEGDEVLATRVTPCDSAEQAFAWSHLVPAPSFVFTRRPSPPKKKK